MSEDRIQRQIEFIIDQQTKLTTDIAELKEGMAELKESQQRTTEHISNLADAALSLTHIVEKQGVQIASLAEQSKETDARLNTLLALVECHITSADAH